MYAVGLAATTRVSSAVIVRRAVARSADEDTVVVLGSTHSDEPDEEAREGAHGMHVEDEVALMDVLKVEGGHFEHV